MQGYLYVENQDAPKLKFQSRFFVLFPFCGLRWFTEEPEDLRESRLLSSGDDGGWIFGGNVRISSVVMEETDKIYAEIYPFCLSVMARNQTYHIRLATDDEDIRILWTDQIKKAIYIQNYIHSCIQCDAIPSKAIFCAALAGHDVVNIENVNLTVPTLGTLVMICKFNYNLGTSLKAIHLENCQLTDNHCPLISSLLSFTPLLESLSLSNNYLTDDGFVSLATTIQNCKKLNLLDLSSNFLSDIGVNKICKIFQKLKKLHHLDFSRNKLGDKSAKYLALHLTGYDDSQLSYLNLSYNAMGNSVTQLVSLLLFNENSSLINVDISFCHISTTGFKELCTAIPKCKSLQLLNVCGNFADDITLGQLMESVRAHQRMFGVAAARNGESRSDNIVRREALYHASSHLDIQLGGMLLTDAKSPKCLSFTTMRSSLSRLTEVSSMPGAVLRKRVDVLFAKHNANEHNALNHQKRHKDLKVPKYNVIVCVRVQLAPYMESSYEVVEALAAALKCDPRQLAILSAAEIDDSDSTFIIFTILDATSELQSGHVDKIIKKRCLDNASYGNSSVSQGAIWLLPSAEKIAIMLQQLAHKSSPLLRTVGIRTVYIQRRDKFTNAPMGISYQCHINGAGSGGNGIRDTFIPPLFPYAEALQEMRISVADPYLDPKIAPLDIDSIDDVSSSRQRTAPVTDRVNIEALSEPGYFFQEDDDIEDDRSPMALSELDVDDDGSLSKLLLYQPSDMAPDMDATLGTAVKTVQVDDAKFLSLIKRLKLDYEINTEAGSFWSAVFSDPSDQRCSEIIDNGLKTAYNAEGIFHNVGKRLQLGTTMFERDKEGLTMNINSLKLENVSGGTTMELGERLLQEITMLRHDAGNLDALAQGPDDIGIVEEFLINCGRIGYTGPEILVAVELREYLVQWAMELDENFEQVHLGDLKQRALITNLMISRNFDILQSKLGMCRHTISESLFDEASTLLDNYKTVRNNLTIAMSSNDRQQIEFVLAEAAYYNIYDDIVVEAIEFVNDMSSDVSTCFAELVSVLQTGSKDDLEKMFEYLDNIGWNHPVVDREALLKMFNRRNQLIEETDAMNDLTRISNILQQLNINANTGKSNENLENTPVVKTLEIMSCIRTVKSLGLAQLQEAKVHLNILETQVKKAAKMASQEDEILQLIDSRDYEKLAEMLNGVGSGNLVMCAHSEEEKTEWIQMMELVCKLGSPKQLVENTPMQNEKLKSLYKCGTLEKAARGKERIQRNWRQRYFVLEGLTISYYTKEGGERKGCVRVGGGRVREVDPSEDLSSGKRFCFELREGRDLSAIDPDLIKEAHRQIKQVETEQYNEKLQQAVNSGSGDACSVILKDATDKGYELETEVVGEAKMLLLRLQQVEIKKELRTVCKFIPRGQIQEVLKKSVTFRLDQDLWMCKLGRLLTERAEAELAILRSRGWLKMQDENAFKRSLASVQRFDLKRLGNKEKKLLAAVLLQNAGETMDRAIQREGCSPADALDNVTQTLEGVMQYFVETEPMQLARLVIAATNQLSANKKITNATAKNKGNKQNNFFSKQHSSVVIMQDSSTSGFLRNKTELALEKYMYLRANNQPSGFLSRKSTVAQTANEQSEAADSLQFSAEGITTPLVKMNKSLDKESTELFKALQVVMRDRQLDTCLSSRSTLFVGLNAGDGSEYALLASRIVESGISTVALRDELYIQVLKQLTRNPNIKSIVRGWTILCVYLHCFPPTSDFFPYVKYFMAQALQRPFIAVSNESGGAMPNSPNAKKRNTMKSRLTMGGRLSLRSSTASSAPSSKVDPATTSSDEDMDCLKKLIAYSNKVIQWTEEDIQYGVSGFQSDISLVDEHLMHEALKQTRLKIKVGVMTGSVYEISFYFGELSNVFTILMILFQQMLGSSYSTVESLKTMPNGVNADSTVENTLVHSNSAKKTSTSGQSRGPSSRVSVLERSGSTFFGDRASASGFKHPDIIAKCFRGFCLYDENDDEMILDARYLPVQPSHSKSIAWNRDVVWDTLLNYSNSSRLLFLRRKFLLVSELLIDSQLDLFGDEVSAKDTVGLRRLWVKWLSDSSPDLPVDHIRIDMLFAEESRYVNSQLYGVSDDGCAYLMAIQLMLTWNVDEENMMIGNNLTDLRWGNGHSQIMHSIDPSVRPSSLSVQRNMERSTNQRRMMGTSGVQKERQVHTKPKNTTSLKPVAEDDEESCNTDDHEGDEISDDGKNSIHFHGKVLDINALEESDIKWLKAKLEMLGSSEANNTPDFIESVAYFMSQFQGLAREIDVATHNQRFRYMMKCAYLSYVMSWPLAGGSFAMSTCDITGKFVPTLVCVSASGLYMLTVDDWSLVFYSPLYDIESYVVTSTTNENAPSSDDKLLTVTINELHIKIISASVDDLRCLLDGLCLELLAKGVYRHGLEGGFDILDKDEAFIPSTDPAAVFRRFQTLYSFLPVAPTPLPMTKSRSFVEPPKSRRAILAEARAEEERIELEQARLAAQAAADRNQAHIAKGRQALTTMMEDDDDDEEDDDDEGGVKKSGKPVKRQRRRISLLGKGRQHVNPLQMRMQMVENAVCGVSSRPSHVEDVLVPPIPERRTGMRTDSMLESGLDLSEKPPLLSANKVRDTSTPFNENMKREVMLLPKEASKLKKIKFPVQVQWHVSSLNKGSRSLQKSMACEWLLESEITIDDGMSVQEFDVESERKLSIAYSEDVGLEERKDNDDSSRVEVPLEHVPLMTDKDDASFYSHELLDANDGDGSTFSHELENRKLSTASE